MGEPKPRQTAQIRVESGSGAAPRGSEEVPREVRWFVQGVRAIIGARHLTQARVAEMLGGGAPYLSNVLSLEPERMRRFRFHYACLLARALDTDLIYILSLGRSLDVSTDDEEEGDDKP